MPQDHQVHIGRVRIEGQDRPDILRIVGIWTTTPSIRATADVVNDLFIDSGLLGLSMATPPIMTC
jgi:hypothetical protein